MNDHEYFISLSKILIQIQKPLWSKDECYKSLCLEIDNSDFALSNDVTHAAHEKHAFGFSFQTWLRK